MRRVWFLIVLVLLAGVALACSVLLWWPPPVEFTKDMDGRIRPGMTEAEVVAVLGLSAGNYARGVPTPAAAAPAGDRQPGGAVVKAWVSDTGAVTVEIGPDGRVVNWCGKFVDQSRLRSPLDFVRLLVRRLFG